MGDGGDATQPATDSGLLGGLVRLDPGRHGFGDLCPGAQSGDEGAAAQIRLRQHARRYRLCRIDFVRAVPGGLGLLLHLGTHRRPLRAAPAAWPPPSWSFRSSPAPPPSPRMCGNWRCSVSWPVSASAGNGRWRAPMSPKPGRRIAASKAPAICRPAITRASFWRPRLNFTVGAAFGWRAMFLCGAVPILVALFTLSRVKEPARWKERHAGPRSHPLRMIFTHEYRKRTIVNAAWYRWRLSDCGRARSMSPPRF